MHNYPSDITRPRDLYDIFCAYVLRGVVANVTEILSKLEIGLLLLHSVVKA